MKIGVLKCGDMNPALAGRWGEYPQIYTAMLHQASPDIAVEGVDVDGGQPLDTAPEVDGWIISGSRHGVYEDHPWIAPLKAFLRAQVAKGTPVVGVCFGHQILAEALGGRAEKFSGGWGVGATEYGAVDAPGWARDLGSLWTSNAVHQDQVGSLPPDATVIARNDFCANAALAYGDPANPYAISVQPHPEFGADFLRDLIDKVLADKVPAEQLAQARSRLETPLSNAQWARLVVDFFETKNAGT